jgi:flagellar basal body-associated protein FliL
MPLVLLMLIAWLVGLCGMVGYFRWFFRSEVDQQTRR